MRAARDGARSVLFEQRFQLFDESRFEDVLDEVCFPIDAAGCDVREVNQIELPQTMISDGAGGQPSS